jgi:hypothetical protein
VTFGAVLASGVVLTVGAALASGVVLTVGAVLAIGVSEPVVIDDSPGSVGVA